MVFPRLFRLAHYPDIKVANVWIADTEAGDSRLGWNLNELETIEWASLSKLFTVKICASPD